MLFHYRVVHILGKDEPVVDTYSIKDYPLPRTKAEAFTEAYGILHQLKLDVKEYNIHVYPLPQNVEEAKLINDSIRLRHHNKLAGKAISDDLPF